MGSGKMASLAEALRRLWERCRDPAAHIRRGAGLCGTAFKGMVKDDTFGMGAALAFYTIFSLGPVLVIATVVGAQVIGGEKVREELLRWTEYYLSAQGVKFVSSVVEGAGQLLSGVTATVIGVITLFIGATGVFGRLKISLNVIWGAERERRPVVRMLLLGRLEALAAACAVGFVIFLGLLLSAGITAVGSFLGRWLPVPGSLLFVINMALSLVIVTPLFALIFKFMPSAKVPWRSVLVGSAVTAILFQAGALAIGAYLGARLLASVYGPAGSVLAVLVWSYYSAQTVLFGAEFTKAHAMSADGPPASDVSPADS